MTGRSSGIIGDGPNKARLRLLVVGTLFFGVLAVFWPATEFGFIAMDDFPYVANNPFVLNGITFKGAAWALGFHEANWHPVTWISHMLDAQVFGARPGGCHFINICFHAANTALVFLLFLRMTGSVGRSAILAALFGLHPLRVESVAWVAERKDVLSVFFGLLALFVYADYGRRQGSGLLTASTIPDGSANQGPRSSDGTEVRPFYCCGTYYLVLALGALALLSKPMLVTLPFLMLLLDFWPLKRIQFGRPLPRGLAPLVVEKLPLFLLVALTSWMTFLAQRAGGAVHELAELPLSARVANAMVSYVRYLGKMFWPSDLVFLYPMEPWPVGTLVVAACVVVLLTVLALLSARNAPFFLVGWFWFLGTLVPVIGLVQVGMQSLADRYTYLPSLGVTMVVVWGSAELLGRWRTSWGRNKRATMPEAGNTGTTEKTTRGFTPGAAIVVLPVLAALCFQTRYQLSFWRDTETLYGRTLAVTKVNPAMVHQLVLYHLVDGETAWADNQIDEAERHYREALRLNTNSSPANDHMGTVLQARGDIEGAMQLYYRALALSPTNAHAHNNLAVALASKGDINGAIEHLEASLRLAPDNPGGWNNLGALLVRREQIPQAIEAYRRAIRLNPGVPAFHVNLGNALAREKQFEEAVVSLRTALNLKPGDPPALLEMGTALLALNRPREAVAYLESAVQVNPGSSLARQRLAEASSALSASQDAATNTTPERKP
jgi:Flp pilus assembly protein TadD